MDLNNDKKAIIKNGMKLYLVTDRQWLGGNSLEDVVEEAIKGGVTFVQLREKDTREDEFIEMAIKVKKVTDKYSVPFVINDNVKIAKIVHADGVHIGQSDVEFDIARETLGHDKIIGLSTSTVEMALNAQKKGADYIGVGAVFNTSTKNNTNPVEYSTLKAICESVSIPVVAIGGINETNIPKLKASGIDGIAVVSAILAKKDVKKASENLTSLVNSI